MVLGTRFLQRSLQVGFRWDSGEECDQPWTMLGPWVIDFGLSTWIFTYIYICTYMHIYIYIDWLTFLNIPFRPATWRMVAMPHWLKKISSEVWHQKGQILGIYLGMYLVDIHVYQRISMGYIRRFLMIWIYNDIYIYIYLFLHGKSTWTRDSSDNRHSPKLTWLNDPSMDLLGGTSGQIRCKCISC